MEGGLTYWFVCDSKICQVSTFIFLGFYVNIMKSTCGKFKVYLQDTLSL
jgi:hypothetical protein